ncbi:MAG: hypothetical protein JJT94_09305 [Bernardetiaceae bacterium]|nr:hypothetical protein [Bernardetiaceae bacterium]
MYKQFTHFLRLTRFSLLFAMCLSVGHLVAQNDEMLLSTLDSSKVIKRNKELQSSGFKLSNPARMGLLSAAVPGLGQYYNENLWLLKVPIIYGMGAGMAALTIVNHNSYRRFRAAHWYRNDDNRFTTSEPFFNGRTDDQIIRQRDRYRRDRNFYAIMLGIVYLLNVGEAATAAKANEIKVNKDLSLRISPSCEPVAYTQYAALGFSFRLGAKTSK